MSMKKSQDDQKKLYYINTVNVSKISTESFAVPIIIGKKTYSYSISDGKIIFSISKTKKYVLQPTRDNNESVIFPTERIIKFDYVGGYFFTIDLGLEKTTFYLYRIYKKSLETKVLEGDLTESYDMVQNYEFEKIDAISHTFDRDFLVTFGGSLQRLTIKDVRSNPSWDRNYNYDYYYYRNNLKREIEVVFNPVFQMNISESIIFLVSFDEQIFAVFDSSIYIFDQKGAQLFQIKTSFQPQCVLKYDLEKFWVIDAESNLWLVYRNNSTPILLKNLNIDELRNLWVISITQLEMENKYIISMLGTISQKEGEQKNDDKDVETRNIQIIIDCIEVDLASFRNETSSWQKFFQYCEKSGELVHSFLNDSQFAKEIFLPRVMEIQKEIQASKDKEQIFYEIYTFLNKSPLLANIVWKILLGSLSRNEFDSTNTQDIFQIQFQHALTNKDLLSLEGQLNFLSRFEEKLILEKSFVSLSFHQCLLSKYDPIISLALQNLANYSEQTISNLIKKDTNSMGMYKGKDIVKLIFESCLSENEVIYSPAFAILRQWNNGILFVTMPDAYITLYENLRGSAHYEEGIRSLFEIEWPKDLRHKFISYILSREEKEVKTWTIVLKYLNLAFPVFSKEEYLNYIIRAAFSGEEAPRNASLNCLQEKNAVLASETWFMDSHISNWSYTANSISLDLLEQFNSDAVRQQILDMYKKVAETRSAATPLTSLFLILTGKLAENVKDPRVFNFLLYLAAPLLQKSKSPLDTTNVLFSNLCKNFKYFIMQILDKTTYLPLIQALAIFNSKEDFQYRADAFLCAYLVQYFTTTPVILWPPDGTLIKESQKWESLLKTIMNALATYGKSIKIFIAKEKYYIRELANSWFGAAFNLKEEQSPLSKDQWGKIKQKFDELHLSFEEIPLYNVK